MAALCGKRSSSTFFESEEQFHSSPPSSKRIRCSPQYHYNEGLNNVTNKCLNDSELGSTKVNLDYAESAAVEANIQSSTEGDTNQSDGHAASENQAAADNLPGNGNEWVELFVSAMMTASSIDDAKARAAGALELLEKSIVARAGAEAAQNVQKENMLLKEQVDKLHGENTILKQAVQIQHRRQKEFDERSQELLQMKHLASQQHEQLGRLRVENYGLTLQLRQAEQNSAFMGRYNPDVF